MGDEHSLNVNLRPEIDGRINFAMQQNDVPVVKAVHVENGSHVPLRDLRLRITPEPDFAEPWEARIELIAEGSTYNLEAVDLMLSPRYLGELTERVRGQLRFELSQGTERLLERVEPVELLTRDEWSGLASLPEILAAFVMPNHPAVEHILRRVANTLGAWTGDPSLSGYQSKDPRRVYTMAGAIYTALQHLGITYINPPASFETEGQRVRFPDRIVESRIGTCLDLAVLAAGCLEQAGLHPLVVLVQGHAFVGVWRQEECFGEPAIDEPLRLRKRVDLDEIGVFDPTCVSNRPSRDFNDAVRAAKRRLENPAEFLCAIDVLRARKGQIRPLPEQVERPEPRSEGAGERATVAAGPSAPDVSVLHTPMASRPSAEETRETPATRLDRWRRAGAKAMRANLTPLVEAYERGEFQSHDLRRVFERSYYQWWHTTVVSAEPVLAHFFSPEHERYTELTQQLIAARLAERVPASSAMDLPNSEVGIFKREIAKQRRQMSVRKLFGTIPNLLTRLKPCLLMSPLSVAQYLDPSYPPFDLVVFDEASQIPVWDAVGAIARGKQAVIVGDPKQLPAHELLSACRGPG
jgi:hypothetical protein